MGEEVHQTERLDKDPPANFLVEDHQTVRKRIIEMTMETEKKMGRRVTE